MSFLTAEKRTTLPVAPRGGGGKTYLGNARLKTFFFIWTPSLTEWNLETRTCMEVDFDDGNFPQTIGW